MAREIQPYILISKKNRTGERTFYIRIKATDGHITERSLHTSSKPKAITLCEAEYQKYLQECSNKDTVISYGEKGLSCKQLFDIVYLREDNPLYFAIHNVSPSIKKKVISLIRNHVITFFGDTKSVKEISLEDVAKFRTYLSLRRQQSNRVGESTLSAKYQADIFSYTKAAFELANDIDTENVYKNIFASKALPKIKFDISENRTPAFTHEEIKKLFSLDPKDWENPLVYSLALFCAYTGCRVNEACALSYSDFKEHEDFTEVLIRKNYNPAMKTIKTPKTAAGNRTLILPSAISQLILENCNCNEDSKFIFSCSGQKPIEYRTYSNYLKKAMTKAQIDYKEKELVFYSFRPFYKSFTSPKLSAELSDYVMGHKEKTMGEHYFHFDCEVHAPMLLKAVEDLCFS